MILSHKLWRRFLVVVGICLAATSSTNEAFSQDATMSGPYWEIGWPSWRSRWNDTSTGISYGSALTHCTRRHQKRLPVMPPLQGPTFGYHQTGWRKITDDYSAVPTTNIPATTFQGHEERQQQMMRPDPYAIPYSTAPVSPGTYSNPYSSPYSK